MSAPPIAATAPPVVRAVARTAAVPTTVVPRVRESGAGPLRVAVVDNSTVVQAGLPLLLGGVPFVGAFPDTESLLAARPEADVVVLDIQLGAADSRRIRHGVEAVEACHHAGYIVCVYTLERRMHLLARCLRAGARAVVHKSEPTEALGRALAALAQGGVAVTTVLGDLTELAEGRDSIPELTNRQRQVLSGRARGETFRSIARRLAISEKTAQEHWRIVTEKFAGFLRSHSAADLERLLGWDSADLTGPFDGSQH